jgi:hypothetical protein
VIERESWLLLASQSAGTARSSATVIWCVPSWAKACSNAQLTVPPASTQICRARSAAAPST